MLGNRVVSVLVLSLIGTVTCAAELTQSKPREVMLTTQDNVILQCVYYAGTGGKETVPIILLHGWKGPRGAGSGRDFDGLAADLQASGHTVIVPDLRGHGGSTMRRSAGGTRRAFHRDRLGASDFAAMVQYDVEAAKKFLIDQHNEGQVNIELLCVVGADMGAAIAAHWAVQDWSWPRLPNLKQGQDVRGLVLISPAQRFKNLSTQKALAYTPLQRMPMMIIYGGKDTDFRREARRLHNRVRRFHREPASRKQQTLFLVELPTSLQGTQLLNSKLDTSQQIQDFVRLRIVSQRNRVPWRPRTSS